LRYLPSIWVYLHLCR